MTGEVEERVDLGDRHLFRSGDELDDFVAGLHLALFEDAEVEAGAMVETSSAGIRGSFMRIPTR